MARAIRKEVTVAAPVREVWAAWTTEEGVVTFFAPQAIVGLANAAGIPLIDAVAQPFAAEGEEVG